MVGVLIFFIALGLLGAAGMAVEAPDSGWENRRHKRK